MSEQGIETSLRERAPDPQPTARRRWRRRAIGAGVVVLAIVAGILAINLSASPSPPALPPAPHFSLPSLGGGPALRYPSPGLSHRPVILVLFASWCTPCQKELPVVAKEAVRLERAHANLRFVGIDGNDPVSAGLAFIRRSKVRFPAASDEQEVVASELGLSGLPDTVFINAAGHVVHIVVGPVSDAQLARWADALAVSAPSS